MRQLGAALGLALLLSATLPHVANAGSLATTYAVGAQPWGMAVDPMDGRMYVANSYPDATGKTYVSVIDRATGNVSRVLTPKSSALVAVDPSLRRLYVTQEDRALLVIDLDDHSVVATVPGVAFLGLAVDADAHRVYATTLSTMSIIDGSTNTVVRTIPAPSSAVWKTLALDVATDRVYVLDVRDNANSLDIFDSGDLSSVGNVPLPNTAWSGLAVDSARQLVFVTGYNASDPSRPGYLNVIDATARSVAATVALYGSFPVGVAHAAGAHRLYITNSATNNVSVLDDRTFASVTEFSLPWLPNLPLLADDGLLYVSGYVSLTSGVVGAITPTEENVAPVVDSVRVDPTQPLTNQVVHATATAHDVNGDSLSFRYAWYSNGVLLANETSADLDLSKPGNGDRGQQVSVIVRAWDGSLESTLSTRSSWAFFVGDTAPSLESISLDNASPRTRDVVVATAVATDVDSDNLTYTFTWKVNGAVRATASSSSTSSQFDLAVAGNGDRGQTVLVEVVVSDGALQSGVASASAVVVNSAPTLTVSLSDTTPRSYDVLVATAGAQDADSDPLTLTYTWAVNGVTKQAGLSSSFDLGVKGNGDNGDVVTVIATANDGTATATANASATVTPGRRK
ncbi:MAG: YncE family protein [Chloroflexota bacterium]|nr:YncE family protein [Chloroflexota bacterium]